MSNIVVIGSMNADVVLKVKELPRHGETISAESYHVVPGGKGGNQAVAAARLGTSAKMFGSVGSDDHGKFLLESLRDSKVGVGGVRKDPELPTGMAFITVAGDGTNMIVVNAGANAACSPEHIAASEQALQNADALILQLEIPVEAVQAALELAKKHSVLTVLNPAPPCKVRKDVFRGADFLIPNEMEASFYTGMQVTGFEQAKIAASRVRQMGASRVIITLGSQGALYSGPDGEIQVPAFPVHAVDTTGAGDCFIAAFTVAWMREQNVHSAMRYACAAAALSTQIIGAQTSFPTGADVERFLAAR